MKYEKHQLRELFPDLPKTMEEPVLESFLPGIDQFPAKDVLRPCVVICPGGAYEFIADREAEPVALRFVGNGIAAFILRYSCGKDRFPAQLLQALAAITYVRRNAKDFSIDPDQIFIMGFSAGGHLACSAGVFWNRDFVQKELNIMQGEDKPNGMLLCYPVISSGEYGHQDSIHNLLGERENEELRELVSLEKQVSVDTPKTFLFHTAEDGLVPAENSLYLTLALRKYHIPVELHLYPYGNHGLSLCDDTVSKECEIDSAMKYNSDWMMHAIKWVKNS